MNFIPRNNRMIREGMLVGVHWNTHKNMYSVVEFKSRNTVGHVLGYVKNITLLDCTVKIDKSKQKAVRDKQRKDRHAYIVGYIEDINIKREFKNKVYYNPFKVDSFVDNDLFQKGITKYLVSMKRVHLNYDFQGNKPKVSYDSNNN